MDTFEKRGPLAQASQLPEPMDLSDNPIPESMELSFLPHTPQDSESSKEQEPIDLEVTGIGGVWPADNFAVSVRSRHARITQQEAQDVTDRIPTKSLPPRIAHVFEGTALKHKARSRGTGGDRRIEN